MQTSQKKIEFNAKLAKTVKPSKEYEPNKSENKLKPQKGKQTPKIKTQTKEKHNIWKANKSGSTHFGRTNTSRLTKNPQKMSKKKRN